MSKATREQSIKAESKSVFNAIVQQSDEYKSMLKGFTTDEKGKGISRKKAEIEEEFNGFLKTDVMSTETVDNVNGKDIDRHTFALTNCSQPDFHNGTVEELLTVANNLATLKVDAQAILDNSYKQDITDSNLMNTLTKSCLPVVSNLMTRNKSNEKWTQWKVIDLIYKSVGYNPLSKDEDFVKSGSFEVRATRVAKRIALSVEHYNPSTKQFADEEQGYRINADTGDIELPYAVLCPQLPAPVAGSSKTVLVDNDSEEAKATFMPVGVRIVDDHYANAYKTKKGTPEDDDLNQEQKYSKHLTAWLEKKEALYQKFIDTEGVKSNAEIVGEDVFTYIEELGLAIDNFTGTRQDAEKMAGKIEGTPEEEEQAVA